MSLDSYALLRQASFGLVDQLAIDALPCELRLQVLRPAWFRGDASLLPALVDLRELSTRQIEHLLSDYDSTPKDRSAPAVAQILFTQVDEGTLRAHLAHRLTVRLNGRSALLRYYDPRVLLQLTWMLTQAQLSELFGPVDRLAYWVDGQWHTLDKADDEQPASMVDAQRIARIGLINEVVGDQSGREALVEASRYVETALITAEQHGLIDEDDRIAFARHVMDVHPRLDAHPKVAAMLKSVDQSNSYRDIAALLSDDDWQRIAQELEHTATTRTVQ
ncbi:hypothetical protein N799_12895 [Lysobacter arseniciresistens ZS79]|uniref:DUF4123 domain-containing protein n=1 Tax=Lysobacter arseniciresistens ZS79 TaxID=913325 RepID=A0A0A0EU09_9GAMM|nr:DUF4123 domain-containing protein [Lysobacter arseniciresistens]KGM52652.1 hypothetical protein N799_12895 [Lysobacter arseniciresistens ZS79]